MVSAAALPVATALRRAERSHPTHVVVCPRSTSCHLYVVTSTAGRLTRTGTVPTGRAPVCGQRARRWRAAPTDVAATLPLCGRCSTWVERHSDYLAPALNELVDALRTVRRLADVEHLVLRATQAQLATALVGAAGTRAVLPLHRVVADARARIAPPTTPRPQYQMTNAAGLTCRGRAVLAFERLTWRRPGAKDAAVRDLFDLSPTRYAQQLNDLIDHPAAVREEPAVVHRLHRQRNARRRERLNPTVTHRPHAGPLVPVRSTA